MGASRATGGCSQRSSRGRERATLALSRRQALTRRISGPDRPASHHPLGSMSATEFASARPLDAAELEGAPVHYPRPSRLLTPLRVEGSAKSQRAAESIGL